jgi:rod shape determining protein RodA
MTEFFDRLRRLNWFFIFLVFFLAFVGLVMIFSATYGMKQDILLSHATKIFIGLILMILVGVIDIDFWKKYAFILYFFGLILLFWASFYGFLGKGSRRWISFLGFNFQPSELMKILIIVSLSKFFDEKKIQDTKDYFFLILPITIVIIPFLLILKQPDLGTAMMVLFVSLIVFFLAGLSWKFFALMGALFLVVAPYLWGFLKDYQKTRILTLFNPENDPLGSGYHIIQSQIAIGSGGFFGKGWLKGTQSHLDFLPEKHTDFIFSMLGEEFGFLGTISVIGLIVLITYSSYQIFSAYIENDFDRILGYAIISNFFFAALINMSMVVGILPVVGLPFPLVSYGGSSMITYFLSFGIILSLHRNIHSQLSG